MLYLGDGVRQVQVGEHEVLQVFPDFSDPQQFYYLPNFPHVAKMDDGAATIRLLVYRQNLDEIPDTAADAVAFLSLDVDLSWPPEVIERAASKLRVEGQLPTKPRLTPIFFSKGSVRLIVLDAATPEDTAERPPDAVKASEFVTKIMGAASPSLYGDNRAIFQASLSKKGAAALSGALDGMTPIGVVYSLTFAGLQPAFHIKAKVDWHKVYNHFSERKNLNLLFYEKDIQKSIDKLIEDKVIDIDVSVEGIGAEAMDAEREPVMMSIRQLIFDKFFEATLKPVDPAGGGIGGAAADTAKSVAQSAFTLGMGYSYKTKDVTIDELRSLDIDWTARKAAERTIYPQAHMYNVVGQAGLTKERLITVVTGSDDMWRVLPFEVRAAAAWETDGIAGVTVDIEYDDADAGASRDMSVFLSKGQEKIVRRDWMDRKSGKGFRYKYEVVFQDGAVPGPSPKVSSGPEWLTNEGTALVITPRDLYDTIELEVGTIPNFPFERWPAVLAVLRYRADDGSFEHYADGVLKSGATSFKTRFRVDKKVSGRREVQLTFMGDSGERVDTPWMPMPQHQWVVTDPYGPFQVRAIVSGDRANIANLIVDFEYADEENRVFERWSMTFNPENIGAPQTWTFQRADPKKSRYRYSMTLVTKAGDFLTTGWISTDAPSIPVGEQYVRQLSVDFVTGELAKGVDAVEVAVVYDDPDGNVHSDKTLRLGPNARSRWEVKLKDASKRAYSLTTTWIRPDGFNPRVGPVATSETYVVIPGSPPR
jgi:hypothetical protein